MPQDLKAKRIIITSALREETREVERAESLSDHIFLLYAGTLLESGPPKAIYHRVKAGIVWDITLHDMTSANLPWADGSNPNSKAIYSQRSRASSRQLLLLHYLNEAVHANLCDSNCKALKTKESLQDFYLALPALGDFFLDSYAECKQSIASHAASSIKEEGDTLQLKNLLQETLNELSLNEQIYEGAVSKPFEQGFYLVLPSDEHTLRLLPTISVILAEFHAAGVVDKYYFKANTLKDALVPTYVRLAARC